MCNKITKLEKEIEILKKTNNEYKEEIEMFKIKVKALTIAIQEIALDQEGL